MGVLERGRLRGRQWSVEWIFTDRHDGISAPPFDSLNVGAKVGDSPEAVAGNRARVADLLGCERLAALSQVHGRAVASFESFSDLDAAPPEADAAVTSVPGLGLMAQAADCVPVVMADLEGGVVACAHAGWRGLAAGVVPAALSRFPPAAVVHAWVGPAICAGCYEVSAQVRDEVAASVPTAAASTRWHTPAIDLRAGVMSQLAQAGVVGTLVGGCTFESPDLFSYRRDGVTGRHVGAIVLHAEPASP